MRRALRRRKGRVLSMRIMRRDDSMIDVFKDRMEYVPNIENTVSSGLPSTLILI